MPAATRPPTAAPAVPGSELPDAAESAAVTGDVLLSGAVAAGTAVVGPAAELVGTGAVSRVAAVALRGAAVVVAVLLGRAAGADAALVAASCVLLGPGAGSMVGAPEGRGAGEAACGQMAARPRSGGGFLPPSCHTHASVERGFGSCVPGPSLA